MLLEQTDDGLRNPEDEAGQELRSDLDGWELIIRDAAPDAPSASVGFVSLLVDRDTDGGLSYTHHMTVRDPDCSPPMTRADMALFTMRFSPTMIRVAELCKK